MQTEKIPLTFREMQLGALEVLKKLAELCRQQGWQYCLAYGSMLGAVRHQGIIPWDDDIDIFMPRPDYERMMAYFREHEEDLLPLKMFDHSVEKRYPHSIVRISDQRYHLEFDNEREYDIGLFVDIYPLDGLGDDMDVAIKLIHKTKWLASLCFLTGRKRFGKDNTGSALKMLLKFPAYCWANLWGSKHYIEKLRRLAGTYDYETSRYVGCVCWPTGKVNGQESDILPKTMFDRYIQVPFEDVMMKIPEQYDAFLTIGYGDYMTPPPPEGRATHHTYKAYKR